jgi:hypothetical protein
MQGEVTDPKWEYQEIAREGCRLSKADVTALVERLSAWLSS